MSENAIDGYLVGVPEPQRSTLAALRKTIQEALPAAEECISYGVPTFKLEGKSIAGFASYKNHCSYLPMSGSVLSTMKDDVAEYETSKGALKFAIDEPLPVGLTNKLIAVRLAEVSARASE